MTKLHIVTSCDAGGRYEEFLPLFCCLWQLAAPTAQIHVNIPFFDEGMVKRLGPEFDRLRTELLPPDDSLRTTMWYSFGNGIDDNRGIPRPSAAKFLRLMRAASLPDDDVVMLVDVDLIPIAFRPGSVSVSSKLVAVGGDAYQWEYRFPICFLFARGRDWQLLADTLIDDPALEKETYSDETALERRIQTLIAQGELSDADITVIPRQFQGGTTTKDRINRDAHYDRERLMSGLYMDAHLQGASDSCVVDILDYWKATQ